MEICRGMLFVAFFFFTVLLAGKVEDHLIDISDVIWKVPTSRKVVALTFDDGPVSTFSMMENIHPQRQKPFGLLLKVWSLAAMSL